MSQRRHDDVFLAFKRLNAAIASFTDQACGMKPEVALLMELYEGRLYDRQIETKDVGRQSGLSYATTIRCLKYLEERGWVIRSQPEIGPHPTYLQLTPHAFVEFCDIFLSASMECSHSGRL